MKAISILGSSSNAGKSWIATAFCSLLRRKGYQVAPFKAQNMSNNAYVTLEGGEIGRAQAAQAEAAGLRPVAEMNPVLLKPTGDSVSQVVLLGEPGEHVPAREYQDHCPGLWDTVAATLDGWRSKCEVLILEGAGSPVELNLMSRDIVNLRPIEHLDGRWILVCDIERGGVFAQAAGTCQLMPETARAQGIGLIANKFRGDPTLFADAGEYFARHLTTPYLGVLPHRANLQPEQEDNYGLPEAGCRPGDATIAWIRFPHISNTSDAEPWQLDEGVGVRWVETPSHLDDAKAIILPGSKNTLEDLNWMRRTGLAAAIIAKAEAGIPVVGICGGYQMLGQTLSDAAGQAGSAGTLPGLNLLPVQTTYSAKKTLRQVEIEFQGARWTGYEIHMGQTVANHALAHLSSVKLPDGTCQPGLFTKDRIWGTYLHGLFESPALRSHLMELANVSTHHAPAISWTAHKQAIYDGMADLVEEHLDLANIWQYLDD